jgi:hypothetical protein
MRPTSKRVPIDGVLCTVANYHRGMQTSLCGRSHTHWQSQIKESLRLTVCSDRLPCLWFTRNSPPGTATPSGSKSLSEPDFVFDLLHRFFAANNEAITDYLSPQSSGDMVSPCPISPTTMPPRSCSFGSGKQQATLLIDSWRAEGLWAVPPHSQTLLHCATASNTYL